LDTKDFAIGIIGVARLAAVRLLRGHAELGQHRQAMEVAVDMKNLVAA
jgi:hypothetical protein